MSEANNQATAILLPSSRVAVFSRDAETLQSARNVEQDWRFARVSMTVEEGDINTAISAYRDAQSPDLIIVQTDTIDDGLTAQLEKLAAHCNEGTAAIVIGPVNDVYLYRKLIEMGVSDYLVKPISAPDMAEVMAKTLIERLGATGSRLIAFIGSKGGVGASTMAQAAAWGVSGILGQKTMLLDVSGGWSSINVGMGFEPSTTLAEAARAAANDDEDSIKRMLFKAGDKLNVLASGGDVMLEDPIAPEQLEELVGMLLKKHPVVIADISHATPELEKTVLTLANQIILVSTPVLSSLRLARALVREISEIRGGDDEAIELVINMQGLDAANEVAKGDIEKAMEHEISCIIPYSGKVFLKNESEAKKLIDDKEGLQILKSTLLPVVQKILAVDVVDADKDTAQGGLIGGFLSKLKSK